MARFAARYLVEQGLASCAMVSLVYSMGRAQPVHVQAVGTGEDKGRQRTQKDLTALLKQTFDFRPEAIAERLNLFQPVYRATATYGHFGRAGFPWEETMVVEREA
jgi:S-adenosylmethionine synthetase